ncbi:hypothetical protein L0F63_002695 [Massospora cicadina]|nr:hypothetical protein L0F63_002695 [Massospora cicadina]
MPPTQPSACAYNDECMQFGCTPCRNWGNVESSLLKMDSLYGASFTSWLKSEENVVVTASYLQRICNEYCFPRILTAVRWLERGWKADSTAWLLRHLTQHWGTGNRCPDDKVDVARATFVQCLMDTWSKPKRAELILGFLELTYPTHSPRRSTFLRTVFEKYDFKALSELFSFMGAGLDYCTKVMLLQEAARRDSAHIKRRQDTPLPLTSPKRTKCTIEIASDVDPNQEVTGLCHQLQDFFEPASSSPLLTCCRPTCLVRPTDEPASRAPSTAPHPLHRPANEFASPQEGSSHTCPASPALDFLPYNFTPSADSPPPFFAEGEPAPTQELSKVQPALF